jgi:hypothetical protein
MLSAAEAPRSIFLLSSLSSAKSSCYIIRKCSSGNPSTINQLYIFALNRPDCLIAVNIPLISNNVIFKSILICVFSFDLNHDMFIDVDDLSNLSVKLKLTDQLASDAGSMIAEVDEDHDGKMSLREVCVE